MSLLVLASIIDTSSLCWNDMASFTCSVGTPWVIAVLFGLCSLRHLSKNSQCAKLNRRRIDWKLNASSMFVSQSVSSFRSLNVLPEHAVVCLRRSASPLSFNEKFVLICWRWFSTCWVHVWACRFRASAGSRLLLFPFTYQGNRR